MKRFQSLVRQLEKRLQPLASSRMSFEGLFRVSHRRSADPKARASTSGWEHPRDSDVHPLKLHLSASEDLESADASHSASPEPSEPSDDVELTSSPEPPSAKPPPFMSPLWRKRSGRTRSTVLFAIAVTSITGVTGQRFYNQPELNIGTIAQQTLYAPEDATVPNEKRTEELRKEAKTAAIPVLSISIAKNQSIRSNLDRYLTHGDALRSQLGPFPVLPTNELSTEVQKYLRQISQDEWSALLKTVRQQVGANPAKVSLTGSQSSEQRAIAELLAYRQRTSPISFQALEQKVLAMRLSYRDARQQLSDPALSELNAAYTPLLFDLGDREWEQIKLAAHQVLTNVLTQGIAPGVPESGINRAVRLHVELKLRQDYADEEKTLATRLLSRVVQANLERDLLQTQQKAEQAAKEVQPVMLSIREGEAIVQVGDEITQDQLVLLDRFGLSQRGQNWGALLTFGGFIALEVAIFMVVKRHFSPRMRRRDLVVILILALSTPLMFLLRLPSSSLPAVGLLVGSFYGSPLGITTVGLLAAALPIGLEIDLQVLVASLASGLIASLMAGRLRAREELAILGLGVGVTQGIVHLVVALILSGAGGPVWYIFLRNAGFYALEGIAWSIVALGVSPYLERLFDLITPIRLAELSNPNRPMLQRLASETPGTFQHTLFVSTLAEAAARALSCNVELVRAGTLYHDIGKMHDPQSFIENQMGGPNKHDLIDDPWESAAIIRKHVTEGTVMARRCRLPHALQAFIPEHQGTMLIAYFYHQAKKMAEAEPDRYSVNESDFRYAGPIPQSKETGIVMLADSCEAALRSLKEATTEEALNMVKKIMRARWQDDQLIDSDLTREELNVIADVFVQIWQQFHHKRIPYPGASRPIAFPPTNPLA